jgi:tetratricopeptide (TPR) repeat protein
LNSETQKEQGNRYYAAKDYDRAVDHYRAAIELAPHQAPLYGNMAAACLVRKRKRKRKKKKKKKKKKEKKKYSLFSSKKGFASLQQSVGRLPQSTGTGPDVCESAPSCSACFGNARQMAGIASRTGESERR